MEILRTIALYAESNELPFLLIGGHAVNAYGIQRQTGDIDLLVRCNDAEKWSCLFDKLKYGKGQNDSRFMRFKPDTIAAWPVDLMLVDDQTFRKMLDESESKEIGAATVQVVSARHLITLKMHALKYYQAHRYVKDYNDLLQLLRDHCKGIRNTDLLELCEKYATKELYDKLSEDLARNNE